MAEPLASWLALREPADHAARSEALTRRIATVLDANATLRVVDLGAGTGSNVRYLADRLPRPRHWLLVDTDPLLLSQARAPDPGDAVAVRALNLGPVDTLDVCAGCHLVTAAALLDLVSENWIGALTARCRAEHAAVLFALTYDGRSECEPPELDDNAVRLLFNEHQRRSDKGFGLAAGPAAASFAQRALLEAGYHVEVARSDWKLGPDMRELQRQLIQGWADAAAEVDPSASPEITSWLQRRLLHVDEGRSCIAVGHQDLAAWLVTEG